QGQKRQPSTEAQRTMQQLWARALSIEPASIGLDDSFFQLGGDSIVAIKLVGEARTAGVNLSVADLFSYPTLDTLPVVFGVPKPIRRETSPFVLLPSPMQEAILSTCHTFGSYVDNHRIADVLPVTDFQKQYLSFCYENPPLAFEYLSFDTGSSLDIELLMTACQSLLDHFPILRSRFLPYNGQFWQVVYQTLDLPFHTFNVDGPLDEACDGICARDCQQHSASDVPIWFTLVRNSVMETRLIIRISHAQYDGYSISHMFKAFSSAYSGKPLGPAISFSNFLAYSNDRREASTQYWSELLKGSHATRIAPIICPTEEREAVPRNLIAKGFISLPPKFSSSTVASLVSCAWAIVLSFISGEDDVVFWRLVAGRNSRDPAIGKLLGPCINYIPVRASTSSTKTSAELLDSIKNQHVSLGESDSMGFNDIVMKCTDWSTEGAIESILHHTPYEDEFGIEFAGASTRTQWFKNPTATIWAAPYISVVSACQDHELKITISSNTQLSTRESTDRLLAMLCHTITRLARSPKEPLSRLKSSLSIHE
ncbi:Condensation multi-domain protein, partial [Pyrenophora tritici-repentis]